MRNIVLKIMSKKEGIDQEESITVQEDSSVEEIKNHLWLMNLRQNIAIDFLSFKITNWSNIEIKVKSGDGLSNKDINEINEYLNRINQSSTKS